MDMNDAQGLNGKLAQAQNQTNAQQGLGDAEQQQSFAHNLQPIDLIINSGRAKLIPTESNKEISLDTLSTEEINKIMASYLRCRDEADNYYKNTIEPTIMQRDEAYLAREEYYKERFKVLSKKSKFCSRDIKTTVDTLLPSFIEVFCGSDDPVDVRGVNVEDDEKATKIQQLLKYQLQSKNTYTSFINYIVKDALILNYAVAKIYWDRQEKNERYEMMISENDVDVMVLLRQEVQNGKIRMVSVNRLKDAPDLLTIVFEKIIVTANYPRVNYMPPSELRFTPDSPDLQSCKFKAHRKIVSGDYLKRKEREGIYRNIDKILEASNGDVSPTSYEMSKTGQQMSSFPGSGISDNDKASKRVELYEAYLSVDYNNDGVYEELIVHAVGNTPIRIARNELEMAPFFICEAESSPNAVFNDREGMSDNLIQQQDLKTAIFRQVIINVAKNNSPQTFVDTEVVDMDAYLDDKSIIPVDTTGGKDLKNAVFYPPPVPINPMAQTILEYSQNEIESQSGSTRYNQGLDSNSLNKTATGLTAILGQAEKRTKNTARLMSESFIVPLMKYVILLNQKYLGDQEIIRLTNTNVAISKQDLDIDYDLIINVGQGAGTQEAQIQYLMILIRELLPVLEAHGITDSKTWYDIVKDLLEKMGLRSSIASLVDPESEKGQALQQQQQQAAQMAAQHELELIKAKGQMDMAKARAPRYSDLPIDSKSDVLEENGIGSTVGNIARQEVINNA